MLSRIAESLYWIGRYVERAEDTARLLDVHYHLLLEDRRADEATRVPRAARRDGRRRRAHRRRARRRGGHRAAHAGPQLLRLDRVLDRVGVGERARRARSGVVGALGDAQHHVPRVGESHTRRPSGPARHDFFGWVRDRAAACNGIVDATMSRDDGWRFYVLGRSLERADMTTRLLCARATPTRSAVRAGPRRSAPAPPTRPTSAPTSTRSTRRQRWSSSSSIASSRAPCTTRSPPPSGRLGELDPSSARAGVDDDARRRLGRVVAELEFLRVDEALEDLPKLLGRMQRECAAVHADVANRYFRETRVIEWSV